MSKLSFQLSEEAMDRLQAVSSREDRGKILLEIIDEEVSKLQEWARRFLGGDLAKFETAAVRTYLYRKITGELWGEGDIENLPRVQLAEHPASAI